MDLKRFGDKVALFSHTTGTGVSGLIRRAALAGRKSPDKLAHALRRKLHRTLSPHRPMPFAQAIHLEVTNACNLKCVMCPRTNMDRQVGFMNQELYRKIIKQLAENRPWIESVALMGLGEPFLHRELLAFAQQARQLGLGRLYTSTNATLLNDEIIEKILSENLFDQLIISIDGANKDTYEAIRPGVSYEIVAKNVEHLLAAKRLSGLNTPAIELQILLMQQTSGEVETFCEHWVPHLTDTDRILVKEVDTFGGQVEDSRLPDQQRLEPVERFACRQLWKDMSIGWDGQVTVCCKDVLYKLAVGDANDERLVDLWRGDRWHKVRRLHLEGNWDRLDPCRDCREWWI